ncbi:MAG: aryl-sulfate sulfotransferase [Acidobacteriota bacterium]|nr:aryl-sulfate sulfotransferase [Acidobacteriota bacterium]
MMPRGTRPFARIAAGLTVAALLILIFGGTVEAQGQTIGLIEHDPSQSEPGHTLFSPLNGSVTYLINNDGHVVHSWQASNRPGLMAYLLPNGNLLRAAQIPFHSNFSGARGAGGRIEEYDWDGTLLWQYDISDDTYLQHHDIQKLPNGNVLLIAWEYKTSSEANAVGWGGNGSMWNEAILEIQQSGPTSGTIVWEWHGFDHLIQDVDSGKPNFGVVADNPQRLDVNFNNAEDWAHLNTLAYNPFLDQIMMSSRDFSEFWIIDHSTTTAEAAGTTGGNYGKGGDILYRWGNPQTYNRGTVLDQVYQNQHDTHWIEPGKPGVGNIIAFNNGSDRTYSSADEFIPAVNLFGVYDDPPGPSDPYEPTALTWTWEETPPTGFFSPIISGADRLTGGNTLITGGVGGNMFEVTNLGAVVWRYICPISGSGAPLPQGTLPAPQGISSENAVFKARRYPLSYSAFTGRTLTPQGPLEDFTSPQPVPNGSGASSPLTATRLTVAGDQLDVQWDAGTCAASEYSILYGDLADVSTYGLLGAECAVGTGGSHTWLAVPSGNLFFLMVGQSADGVYESSWGKSSGGEERNGTQSSFLCSPTVKDIAQSCP